MFVTSSPCDANLRASNWQVREPREGERAKTQSIKIVNYINGINKTLNAKTWFNVKTNGRQKLRAEEEALADN